MDLPPQPDLGHFKDDSTYKETTDIFQDLLHFDVNLLIEEDLLFYFRLSLVETKLTLTLGIRLAPNLLLWWLTYLLSYVVADKMWRASINKHMKWQ